MDIIIRIEDRASSASLASPSFFLALFARMGMDALLRLAAPPTGRHIPAEWACLAVGDLGDPRMFAQPYRDQG